MDSSARNPNIFKVLDTLRLSVRLLAIFGKALRLTLLVLYVDYSRPLSDFG